MMVTVTTPARARVPSRAQRDDDTAADSRTQPPQKTRGRILSGDARTRVRLAAIRGAPLSVDEVLGAVADPAAGGIAIFVGTVRDHDADRSVDRLGYTAHDSAEQALAAVVDRVAGAHDVVAAAATHRVGDLVVGDVAVVVAISAAHRAEALTACRALIDELKSTVPIWKHQVFADGTDEWVGSP